MSETAQQALVNHLVIVGHPSPVSFNAAIAKRFAEVARKQHHGVEVRDLYALGFDPCLPEVERLPAKDASPPPAIQDELDRIERADVIVFVYPLWFGTPPAIIKGYLDRVFGAAFRLDDLAAGGTGHFKGKRLVVLSTSAATLPWLDSQGVWMSLRQSFEAYLETVFGFSSSDHYHASSIVDGMHDDDVARVLMEVEEFTRRVCANAAMDKRRR
ncbi:MAG TPA: NAD(P)H-dependent oxidoreductase [Sphingomicrobium sp.]|jgi:NAD(P)H dehydrogenase (quinone)|nr:NAD(P)H-dependent oxidoreductase [Sphingomicrobium sp.]